MRVLKVRFKADETYHKVLSDIQKLYEYFWSEEFSSEVIKVVEKRKKKGEPKQGVLNIVNGEIVFGSEADVDYIVDKIRKRLLLGIDYSTKQLKLTNIMIHDTDFDNNSLINKVLKRKKTWRNLEDKELREDLIRQCEEIKSCDDIPTTELRSVVYSINEHVKVNPFSIEAYCYYNGTGEKFYEENSSSGYVTVYIDLEYMLDKKTLDNMVPDSKHTRLEYNSQGYNVVRNIEGGISNYYSTEEVIDSLRKFIGTVGNKKPEDLISEMVLVNKENMKELGSIKYQVEAGKQKGTYRINFTLPEFHKKVESHVSIETFDFEREYDVDMQVDLNESIRPLVEKASRFIQFASKKQLLDEDTDRVMLNFMNEVLFMKLDYQSVFTMIFMEDDLTSCLKECDLSDLTDEDNPFAELLNDKRVWMELESMYDEMYAHKSLISVEENKVIDGKWHFKGKLKNINKEIIDAWIEELKEANKSGSAEVKVK